MQQDLSERKTHRVRLEPAGVDILCRDNEVLMHAAQRAGLQWPTVCNGQARCGACHMQVLAAAQALPAPSAKELGGLLLVPAYLKKADTRLACQCRVTGEMTIRCAGVVVPNSYSETKKIS